MARDASEAMQRASGSKMRFMRVGIVLVILVTLVLSWRAFRLETGRNADSSASVVQTSSDRSLAPALLQNESTESWEVLIQLDTSNSNLPHDGNSDDELLEVPTEHRGDAVEFLGRMLVEAPFQPEYRPIQKDWLLAMDGCIYYERETPPPGRYRYTVNLYCMHAKRPTIEILRYRDEPIDPSIPLYEYVDAGSDALVEGDIARVLYGFLSKAWERKSPQTARALAERIPTSHSTNWGPLALVGLSILVVCIALWRWYLHRAHKTPNSRQAESNGLANR